VVLAVLDRFMAALNASDEPARLATLHFPHYRLDAGRGGAVELRGLICYASENR
jgi:hypothetical protein